MCGTIIAIVILCFRFYTHATYSEQHWLVLLSDII